MRPAALTVALFCGCSQASPAPSDAGPIAVTQKISIGPVDLAAGEEKTVCIVLPLGNAEDLVVNGMDVTLAQGSHHLIVYQTTAAATAVPYPCAPFTGIAIGTDTPMVFANKEKSSWTFPSGIAQEVLAGAMVKIEAHYINTSASPIMGRGDVTFRATRKASAPPYQAADFTFWGTMNISAAPHSTATTGKQFQVGIAGTHLIAITTHQHRLGTGVRVWESTAQGQLGPQIANDLNWSDPAWSPLAPAYDFNGTNGLSYECDWNNTTDQSVSFGESAKDEMCFIGGYYYPAQGLDLCIDHTCKNRAPK